ncbi:hypothetical protein KR018_005875 [Drosophila ironensis]|nr:hypothetical protein KR018_005875 [Drosophila ironensis]
MLERIDEQTAAMSQRSERLKMMKLQYQMYFAKLVQNQTLRCIQQTTTPAPAAGGAIPVLLQPQATQPTLVNPPQASPQPWTFAMATPTQAGMVLTPQFAHAPAPAAVPVPVATPAQPPLQSMAMAANAAACHHPVYYPELFGGSGVPLATSNLFDLRATLRAFDNENADLPERMQPHLTGDYQAQVLAAAGAPSTGGSHESGGARQLSSTSSTLATSSLTFDKLPKTSSSLTLTELPVTTPNAPTTGVATITEAAAATATAVATTAARQEARGMPQEEATEADLDAWTNSRVSKVEYEKSPTVVGHNEPVQQQQQQQQQQHDFEAYFGELKIDEPWQEPRVVAASTARPLEDKRPLNVRGSEASGKVGITNDLLDEVRASRAALERAAAAVDEQLARGNQLSPPGSQDPSGSMPAASQPGVSIENIENAIYGERLTGTGTGTAPAPASASVSVPTQGFFENLVTNNTGPTDVQQELELVQHQVDASEAAGHYGQYDAGGGYSESSEPIYASIDSNNQQHQQQQQQQQPLQQSNTVPVEPLYSEIGNPADYTQGYATDASATDAASPTAAPATVAPAMPEVAASGGGDPSGEPQEYSNIDYGNYEAGQYAAGYDPNVAYPGYIYDEATGQYIADPNAAQYAADGGYGGQEYDASGVQNYDYSAYEQQQQQQQQEELHPQQQEPPEVYPVAESSQEVPEVVEPGPAAGAAGAEPPNPGTSPNPKPTVKPTSILSTATDKQAAPNDAQQQQQKKKKRVNFVDSSETDDSSSAKVSPPTAAPPATPPAPMPSGGGGGGGGAAGGGSESDFDFSTGSEAKN